MKISKETKKHFEKNNQKLYDEALLRGHAFISWIVEHTPTGVWGTIAVIGKGVRGNVTANLTFTVDESGNTRFKEDLPKFLRACAPAFMPEMSAQVALISLVPDEPVFDFESHVPLLITSTMVWEVESGEVTPLSPDENQDANAAYLYSEPPAYTSDDENEMLEKIVGADMVRSFARVRDVLVALTKNSEDGTTQLVLDRISNEGKLASSSLTFTKKDGELAFSDSFEDFYSDFRLAIVRSATVKAFLYEVHQNEDEDGLTLRAWNVDTNGLTPVDDDSAAMIAQSLDRDDVKVSEDIPTYDFDEGGKA